MIQLGRNLTAGLLVVTFVVICVCLHLMAELAQLDGARLKLGMSFKSVVLYWLL